MTERHLDRPDGVFGVPFVWCAVSLEDEVGLQVSCVVVSGAEVGDDPRRDAEAAQDCRHMKYLNATSLRSPWEELFPRRPVHWSINA